LHYFFEKELLGDITRYIGTSIGTIICFLLIIGYTPLELMVYFCTHDFLDKIKHLDIQNMLHGHGATSFLYVLEVIERLTIDKIGYYPTMQELFDMSKKTFVCVTCNFTKACSEYIDGGFADNFAIEYARKTAADPSHKTLGIVIMSPQHRDTSDKTVLNYFYYITMIPLNIYMQNIVNTYADSKDVDIVWVAISKAFYSFSLTAIEKLNMFCVGYESAISQAEPDEEPKCQDTQ